MKNAFRLMQPKLVIIRGLPGSGKSTLARELFPFHVLCEADQYFTDEETGEYRFDPSKLKEAHEFCKRKVKENLEQGESVVVANTFTRRWEYEPYLKMAENPLVLIANGNFESVHNVPKEAIERMKKRFEL